MKQRIRAVQIAILILAVTRAASAHAQASPTATQRIQLSAFGGVTGTYTGLNSGKNVGITVGLDFGFRPFFSLKPAIEVRGDFPFYKGSINSEQNLIGGLKMEKHLGRFHPYADFLWGRGQINYGSGYPDPNRIFEYLQSASNVLSPGGGLDLDLTDHLAFKADAQFQRYSTPVTISGHLDSKPVTVGIVYRFNFNHHARLAKAAK